MLYDKILLAEEYCLAMSKISLLNLPPMPNIDFSSYNDNEYLNIISEIDDVFLFTDSITITEEFLKGE